MNEKGNIMLNHDIYHDDSLVEMARLNKGETGKDSIFPYNEFEVKIWSNDHNPPHFHVISDGWDISFTIDTGKLLEIKKKGKKQEVYRYICTHVDKWLDNPTAIKPKDSNRESAMYAWEIIHELKPFYKRLTEKNNKNMSKINMNEKENISLNYDIYHDDSLVEMARLNKGETGQDSIFPYNKFDVKIWSNDHNPPHFHVISDGWDIAFTIESGKLLEIKKKGSKYEVYRYICTHVDEWLDNRNHISPSDTNRKIAFVSWEIIHELKPFYKHLTEAISRGILESLNE